MRVNSQDQTIKKNYIQKYRFLIREYEEVKAGAESLIAEVLDKATYSRTGVRKEN